MKQQKRTADRQKNGYSQCCRISGVKAKTKQSDGLSKARDAPGWRSEPAPECSLKPSSTTCHPGKTQPSRRCFDAHSVGEAPCRSLPPKVEPCHRCSSCHPSKRRRSGHL